MSSRWFRIGKTPHYHYKRRYDGTGRWAGAARSYRKASNDDLSLEYEDDINFMHRTLGESFAPNKTYSDDKSSVNDENYVIKWGKKNGATVLGTPAAVRIPQSVDHDLVFWHGKPSRKSVALSLHCSNSENIKLLVEAGSSHRSVAHSSSEDIPALLLQRVITDHSSDSDSEHYIFTDNDDDGADYCSHHINDCDSPNRENAESVQRFLPVTSNCDENDWSLFQQRRGRLVGQRLLEQATKKTEASSSSSSPLKDSIAAKTRRTRRFTPSFIAYAVDSLRKRISRSKLCSLTNKRTRKFVGKMSPQSTSKCKAAIPNDRSVIFPLDKMAPFECWEENICNGLESVCESFQDEHISLSLARMNLSPLDSSGIKVVSTNFALETHSSLFSSAFIFNQDSDEDENNGDFDDDTIVFQELMSH